MFNRPRAMLAGIVIAGVGCSGSEPATKVASAAEARSCVGSGTDSVSLVALKHVNADGVDVFYREAGRADTPVLLLLHGFPSSSHLFRELMPRLANRYHVIAPDLPGFGFTVVPKERHYKYSFEALARTTEAFVDALALKRYALYVFDYGAPVGFRLALAHPDRISALISQNGNAYEEGLGDAWAPIRRYWATPSKENREAVATAVLNYSATRDQYLTGEPDPSRIPPEAYVLDAALLERPGQKEIQLDLFLDYASNVKLYPQFQEFFRKFKPPTLAIWGKNDPFFVPAGAAAYGRDNPSAVVRMLDAGHFALEANVDVIAQAIDELLRHEGK